LRIASISCYLLVFGQVHNCSGITGHALSPPVRPRHARVEAPFGHKMAACKRGFLLTDSAAKSVSNTRITYEKYSTLDEHQLTSDERRKVAYHLFCTREMILATLVGDSGAQLPPYCRINHNGRANAGVEAPFRLSRSPRGVRSTSERDLVNAPPRAGTMRPSDRPSPSGVPVDVQRGPRGRRRSTARHLVNSCRIYRGAAPCYRSRRCAARCERQ